MSDTVDARHALDARPCVVRGVADRRRAVVSGAGCARWQRKRPRPCRAGASAGRGGPSGVPLPAAT